MRLILRFAGAAALTLVPLSYVRAQTAGKDLAMDFRMTNIVQGMADTGVVTGHVVDSNGKVRIDMATNGAGSPLSPLSTGGAISEIVTDSGKTITYLDSKKSQYLRIRPADMLAQAQKIQGMKMEFSGTEAKVDNLGAGPAILGHPTSHYRVGTGMTMTISAMGQQQTVQIASTTEYFFATDLKSQSNPFSSLTGADMANMFGSNNKDFADKMKAAQDKLPKSPPLRTATSAKVIAQGQTRETNSNIEVTSVEWVKADPKMFDVPASFTSVQLPGMGGGAGEGAIPPTQ